MSTLNINLQLRISFHMHTWYVFFFCVLSTPGVPPVQDGEEEPAAWAVSAMLIWIKVLGFWSGKIIDPRSAMKLAQNFHKRVASWNDTGQTHDFTSSWFQKPMFFHKNQWFIRCIVAACVRIRTRGCVKSIPKHTDHEHAEKKNSTRNHWKNNLISMTSLQDFYGLNKLTGLRWSVQALHRTTCWILVWGSGLSCLNRTLALNHPKYLGRRRRRCIHMFPTKQRKL